MRGLRILFSLLCLTLTQHSFADALNDIQKNKKIRIAVDPTYPPMESEGADGKVVGFDVDFARELAKRLKVDVEFVVMNWDGILAGLTSKRYDVIISSMNITPDRSKQVDFVEYAKMSQVFVAKKGNTLTKEQDLAGKRLAVQADTTSYEFVQNAQKKGITIKEIKAFKQMTEAFAAVKANQADAIVTDEPVGLYYANKDKTFVVTGRAMAPEPVGIAIRKGEASLQKEIAAAVTAMQKDQSLKKISEQWFGRELGK